MATIISNGNTTLSTASGFYRVEADNLCAISNTSLALTTTRYINFTPANAVNGLGIVLWLNSSSMTDREAVTTLEQYQTVTSFNTTTEKVNKVAHGLNDLDIVSFTSTGTLPTNLTATSQYYVRNKTADDFQLSSTPAGAIINLSGTPSGTASVGVARASKTLTTPEIVSSVTTGTYAGRGTYITPFIFTAGYAVDTTASKWRVRVSHGAGTGTWNLYTSDATNPFYAFWGNGAVNFTNNDQLICKDYVTIDQTCTFNGKLGTGETATGCAIVICSNVNNPLPDDVAYLKWDDTPAASYTMTVNGKIYIARFSGFRVGTSTNRIPANAQAIITFGNPTVGTATSGFQGAMTSTTYELGGGGSLFMYGAIPTYSHTHLTADANAGTSALTVADNVDWVNGDIVVVGKQNVQGQGDTAQYTVNSVVGTTINLTGNLATNNRLSGGSVIKLNGYGIRTQFTATATHYIFSPMHFQMSGVEVVNTLISMLSASYYYYMMQTSSTYRTQHLIEDCAIWATGTVAYQTFALGVPPEGILVQRVYSHRNNPVYTISSVFGNTFISGRTTVRDCIVQSSYAGGINYIGTSNNRVTLRDCIFENGRTSGAIFYLQGINVEFYNNTFWGMAIPSSSSTSNGAVNVSQCINPLRIENNTYNNCLVAIGFSGYTSTKCIDENSTFGNEVPNTIDIGLLPGAFHDYIFKDLDVPAGGMVMDETYVPDMVLGSRIGFSNFNELATDDRMIYTYGKTQRTNSTLADTTTLQGDANAFRFFPTSATELFEYEIEIPTGNIQNKDMVVGIWVKINSASYWAGTTYQMPRMTINYDDGTTVYAETAKTTNEQYLHVPFTPSTTAGKVKMTRSGYTDATSTDAYFYWGRSPVFYPVGYIMNNSNLDNWDGALPVNPPISTLFNASDVWAVDATGPGAGTMGQQMNKAAHALKTSEFIALK